MRKPESNLQKTCVLWFRLQYRELALMLFAVPNGGSRNKLEAARLKAEGVTAGVSDLILLVSRGDYTSLCIEMKAGKNTQTPLQIRWMKQAQKYGNKYVVCRSFDEFKNAVNDYFNEKTQDNG